MMGRVTLREVREALAAAKAKGTRASKTSPIVKELKSLARVLEREAKAGAPDEAPTGTGAPKRSASADGRVRHRSRRSAKPRSPRRR
jgi:hypothetical protein